MAIILVRYQFSEPRHLQRQQATFKLGQLETTSTNRFVQLVGLARHNLNHTWLFCNTPKVISEKRLKTEHWIKALVIKSRPLSSSPILHTQKMCYYDLYMILFLLAWNLILEKTLFKLRPLSSFPSLHTPKCAIIMNYIWFYFSNAYLNIKIP